jgi:hypothetical protein
MFFPCIARKLDLFRYQLIPTQAAGILHPEGGVGFNPRKELDD